MRSREKSILPKSFYLRDDVLQIAQELIGKVLVTNFGGVLTSGIISETEAYAGTTDRASHAFGGRRTARTEFMFREGGTAYVYLCYGIHSLFNVVTNTEGIPHAVLIRGIIPLEGKEIMLERSGKKKTDKNFGNGPGKVSKILGIHYSNTGESLIPQTPDSRLNIWIEDRNMLIPGSHIDITPRIGVDYAGDDAKLPYRYIIKNPGDIPGFL